MLSYDSLESFTLIWNLEKVKQEHYAKKYLDQEKKGPNADKEIGTLKRGRPLMLQTVDEKVCRGQKAYFEGWVLWDEQK